MVETFRSHNHKIMAHYAFLNSNNIVTEVITGVENPDGQNGKVNMAK